jgi:hypothetical protein
MRHVDLYPTIASILKQKLFYPVDGIDLTKNNYPKFGLNFRYGGYFKSKSKLKKMMIYESTSAWDFYGGHIFHRLGKIRAFSFFSFRILVQKHPEYNFLLENLNNNKHNKIKKISEAINHLAQPNIKYLKPLFSKNTAKIIIDNYLKESKDFREKIRIKNTLQRLRNELKIV